MEENVALDSSKQKKFVKSIKGIKKLIKKNVGKPTSAGDVPKIKAGGIRKKKHKARGLVYLSHIPHGFYENEMTQYFKQFGMVTNVRVIRSKRTGASKGYAFVEFKEPSVGEIVADTMNNYLMGKRLIKAAYVPPEKQKHHAMRKHWNASFNPGNNHRIKMKKAYNANKDEAGDLERATKLLSNLNNTKKKLGELGINYEFFKPVDVPEVLQNENPVKKVKGEVNENLTDLVSKSKKKNKKKSKIAKDTEDKDIISKLVKIEQKIKEKDVKVTGKSKKQANIAQEKESTKNRDQKQQNLKDQGIKPLEDFIQVQADTDSDDSTYQFDSDEYEKMLENEDESNSDIASDESGGENGSQSGEGSSDENGSDDENGEDLLPTKSKVKPQMKTQAVQFKNARKQQKKFPQQGKRKATETPVAPVKKSKFQKNGKQKPIMKKKK